MKLKPTPFLLVAACFIVIAAWAIFSGYGGNQIGLLVYFCVFGCLLFFGLYYISSRLFKRQFLKQFIIEFIFVIIIAFVYYRQDEKLVLHIPRSFQGHILVVYGVPNEPKLETRNLLRPLIDITVPPSGIIYTSTAFGKKIVLADSSQPEIKMLRPGYGVPFSQTTMRCETVNYTTDIIVFQKLPPGWTPDHDSAKRSEKLRIACDILSRK